MTKDAAAQAAAAAIAHHDSKHESRHASRHAIRQVHKKVSFARFEEEEPQAAASSGGLGAVQPGSEPRAFQKSSSFGAHAPASMGHLASDSAHATKAAISSAVQAFQPNFPEVNNRGELAETSNDGLGAYALADMTNLASDGAHMASDATKSVVASAVHALSRHMSSRGASASLEQLTDDDAVSSDEEAEATCPSNEQLPQQEASGLSTHGQTHADASIGGFGAAGNEPEPPPKKGPRFQRSAKFSSLFLTTKQPAKQTANQGNQSSSSHPSLERENSRDSVGDNPCNRPLHMAHAQSAPPFQKGILPRPTLVRSTHIDASFAHSASLGPPAQQIKQHAQPAARPNQAIAEDGDTHVNLDKARSIPIDWINAGPEEGHDNSTGIGSAEASDVMDALRDPKTLQGKGAASPSAAATGMLTDCMDFLQCVWSVLQHLLPCCHCRPLTFAS